MSTSKERLRRIARPVLTIAGLAVIAWMAWANRQELTAAFQMMSPRDFLVAVAAGLAFMACQGLLFALLAEKLGVAISRREAVAAYLITQPGKYLPGKVWTAVMQAMYVGSEKSLACIVWVNLELFLIACTQMAALGIACLFGGVLAWALAITTGLAFSCLVTATNSHRVLALLFRRLAIPAAGEPGCPVARRTRAAANLLTNLGLMGLNLLASLLVIQAAIPGLGLGDYLPIAAVFYLAFTASFLALPVPAGIGVREAATVAIGAALLPEVPSSTLVVVALVARCWQLTLDASSFGAGLLLRGGIPPRT